ncbi:hypothetical protein CYMTET_5227 [Cymbomonas tetramitiformis]|uniref:Uncharacterized protein n=1 Tax=Cymbomonas tetramitiformis TaxID=36881 RepID=A0AAE0LJK6_9CHLO|nr:hypothetical protein CYMTET_5227 [Cymbomonas tetramitiformis]
METARGGSIDHLVILPNHSRGAEDTYYGRVLELTLEGPPLVYPGEYDELVTEDEPLHAAGSGTPSHTLSQLNPVQQLLQTLRDGLLNSIQRSAAIGNITPATSDTDSQVGDVQQASPFRLVPEALADLRLQRPADPVAPVDEKRGVTGAQAIGEAGGRGLWQRASSLTRLVTELLRMRTRASTDQLRFDKNADARKPRRFYLPEEVHELGVRPVELLENYILRERVPSGGLLFTAPKGATGWYGTPYKGHGRAFKKAYQRAFPAAEDASQYGSGSARGCARLSLVPGLNCYRVVVTKGEPSTEFMIAWAEVCQLLVQARPFVRAAFNTGLKAVKSSNWEMDTSLFRWWSHTEGF